MCTLVIFRNVFSGRPIVVAANRDERFSRASATPTVATDRGVRVLAPTDVERGGTWLGVNDLGRLVAITNRDAIPSVRGLRSRGELVRDALAAPTMTHALAAVMNRDPDDYNAFHLAIVDREEAHLVVGNGVGGTGPDGRDIDPGFALEAIRDGINIITNLGNGPGSPRANAILRAIHRYRADDAPPRVRSLGAMLDLHVESPYEDPMHGTCIHPTKEDPDYGTVSSAVIRLNAYLGRPFSWEYWHRDRAKGGERECVSIWGGAVELPLRQE